MIRNHRLAKSISDAGWGRFIGMIAYKEEESGGRLIRVDANGTTQRCSGCGEKVAKALSVRVHECPFCGLVLCRDLNAALNVLGRGREIGRGPPDYMPVGDGTSIQPWFVEQVSSMNQEASLLVGR